MHLLRIRHRPAASRGWTYIELITVLGIATLLFSLAAPAFKGMLARSSTTAGINRLVTAVNATRHAAVQFGSLATLCALDGENQCGADWGGRLSVFLDRNGNARFESGDVLIRHLAADEHATVTWRVFGMKPYLQMTPFGYTNFQNGNFVICPVSGDERNARQLIVSVAGRTRVNHRRNDDDLPVDRRGRLLRC